MTHRPGLLVPLVCTWLAACSNASTGGGDACVPGDTAACACADGTLATKTCGGDHRYGACRCVDPDEPVLELGGEPDPDGLADRRLDFGAVPVDGGAAELELPVRNAGGGELAVELSALARPFSVVTRPAAPLAAGEAGVLRFRFAPDDRGPAEAAVSVLSNGGTKRIRLQGVGFLARATCTPEALELGTQQVGVAVPFAVTCTNDAATPWPATVAATGPDATAVAVAIDDPSPGDDGAWIVSGTVTPSAEGPLDARLLLGAGGGDPVATVAIAALARVEPVVIEPASVDLGYVAPGHAATARLAIRNFWATPVRVSDASVTSGADLGFSRETPGSFEIPAAVGDVPGEAAIELRFDAGADRLGTRVDGVLELRLDGGDAPRTVPLTAFVGGPVLSCGPIPVDLGEVGIGYPYTVPVTCTNAGTGDPGRADDRLVVTGLSSTDPAFTVAPHGELQASGYEVGETFTLDVTFAPAAPGPASATIAVDSNAVVAADGAFELPATGVGLAVGPCVVSTSPEELDFGQLEPGHQGTLEFGVWNWGTGPCLLRNLSLAPGCDPAFSLPAGGFRTALLAPGATLRVPVRFAPPAEGPGPLGCEVVLGVSSATAPRAAVPLTGVSRRSCLSIEPGELDFGAVYPGGCNSRTRRFKLVSVCAQPVTVTAVRPAYSASAEFALASPVALPATVTPLAPFTFEAEYLPDDEVGDFGGFLVEIDGRDRYLVPVLGRGVRDRIRVDTFDVTDWPKVDVLFVVDRGMPVGPRDLLAAHATALLSVARDQAIDFQVGVTTGSHDATVCPGGGEDGRLVPVDGLRPRVITAATPNPDDALAANLKVGTCASEHFLLDGAIDALSLLACDDPRHPESRDGNCGFLRPAAHLSVVTLSTSDDASPTADPASALWLWKDVERLGLHTIGGPCTGPGYTAAQPYRLSVVRGMVGGTAHSICPADWDLLAREVSAVAFGHDQCFALGGEPERGTDGGFDVTVKLNGVPLAPTGPNGARVWTYARAPNALCFAVDAMPAPGSQVEVRYTADCAP